MNLLFLFFIEINVVKFVRAYLYDLFHSELHKFTFIDNDNICDGTIYKKFHNIDNLKSQSKFNLDKHNEHIEQVALFLSMRIRRLIRDLP